MLRDVNGDVRRHCLKFLGACYFLYVISISIKMVYGAEMVEIMAALGASKSEVSLGLTFYYAAYSAGQFLLAPLIKRLDMRRFMALSSLLSAVTFGLISVADSLPSLYLLLGLGGLCQTGIWGGIMYFVGRYIPKELSGFASKFLGTGLAIGTALTYGFGALFVAIASWKLTFVFFALLTLLSLWLFLLSLKHAEQRLSFVRDEAEREDAAAPASAPVADRKALAGTVLFFGVAVLLGCSIYYGFNNWFPSLLGEVFSMPSEYAIFITLLLPLAQAPCPMVIIGLSERVGSTHRVCALSAFIAAGLLASLTLTYRLSMVLVILLSVVMLFFTRGIVNLICTYIPLVMKNSINSGTLSLIFNAVATVAAAVTPFLSALILDGAGGWSAFFYILTGIAFLLLVLFLWQTVRETRQAKRTLPH